MPMDGVWPYQIRVFQLFCTWTQSDKSTCNTDNRMKSTFYKRTKMHLCLTAGWYQVSHSLSSTLTFLYIHNMRNISRLPQPAQRMPKSISALHKRRDLSIAFQEQRETRLNQCEGCRTSVDGGSSSFGHDACPIDSTPPHCNCQRHRRTGSGGGPTPLPTA